MADMFDRCDLIVVFWVARMLIIITSITFQQIRVHRKSSRYRAHVYKSI